MQNNQFALSVGLLLGVLYCALLTICVPAFSLASVILYGNPEYIGFCVAVFISVLCYVVVVTYEIWVNPVQNAMVDFVEGFTHGDELE